MLAALDTSTKMAGIALYEKGRVVAELSWWSDNEHSKQLLPNLQRLLEMQHAGPEQVTAVAVALGPGSFNGLRVAMSTAKGLCFARALPLIGVGTLAATAYAHRLAGKPVCALIDAGRGQIYGALFGANETEWRPEGQSGIVILDQLLERVAEPTLFCGEISQATAERIREAVGNLAVIASPALALRRAGALAELAWRRLARGEQDDLATLQPIYVQRPPAARAATAS